MKTPNALRKTIATLLICGATLTSSVAFAQDNPVVAKVGDSEITKSALDQAVLRLQQQFASVPENQRRARILDALIDFAVLATEAEKRDLDKQADTVELLKYLRLQALHNAYFRQVIDKSVTEEDLKKAYETQFAGRKPENVSRLREIESRFIVSGAFRPCSDSARSLREKLVEMMRSLPKPKRRELPRQTERA